MNKLLLIFIILLATTITVQAVEANVEVKVTVLPAYRLSLDINTINKIVFTGDKLFFIVDLKKKDLTKLSNKIYVDLNYEILKGKKVVKSGFLETTPLIKRNIEVLNVRIPDDFNPGNYELKVTASNPQSYPASDKDKFVVMKHFKFKF